MPCTPPPSSTSFCTPGLWKMQRGYCNKGNQCQYRHDAPPTGGFGGGGGGKATGRSPGICRNFQASAQDVGRDFARDTSYETSDIRSKLVLLLCIRHISICIALKRYFLVRVRFVDPCRNGQCMRATSVIYDVVTCVAERKFNTPDSCQK